MSVTPEKKFLHACFETAGDQFIGNEICACRPNIISLSRTDVKLLEINSDQYTMMAQHWNPHIFLKLKDIKFLKRQSNINYAIIKASNVIYTDITYFSALMYYLVVSCTYRRRFMRNFKNNRKEYLWNSTELKNDNLYFLIFSELPCIIDFKSSYLSNLLAYERQSLDSAMSWLSTLGGGFSALGDYDLNFAEKAGYISCKQLCLSLKLGDQNLVTRCWLYFALALLQKKKFKEAARIVQVEYNFLKSQPEGKLDYRLKSICHGIWVKLKHEHKVYRNSTRSL